MTRTRAHGERGSALVASILVMTTILAIGLAMMSTVDTQTRQAGNERGRESSFNYAEAVLNAQTFTVANHWPSSIDTNVMDCSWSGSGTPAATNGMVNACPDPTVIANAFSGNVDASRGATWKTSVRDDLGTSACEDTPGSNCSYTWDETTSMGNPHYDSNGDQLLWLRAEGTVNAKKRIVVALVRIQNDPVNLPQAAVIAGSLSVSGGNKAFIYENGSSIALRCPDSADCYSEQKPGVNVQGPGTKQFNYDDGGHVMTDDQIDSMRTAARSANPPRYYPAGTCPSSAAAFSGPVVFLEATPATGCPINHNWQINSPPAKPGIIIVNQGTLRFNGTADIWGLIYMVNAQNAGPSDPPLFDGLGNGTIHGALFVDGQGRVNDQGSFVLDYDATALNGISALGATGIVPNSFREINP